MADPVESAYETARSEVSFLRWIFGWNLLVGWLMVTFLVGGVGYFIGLVYEFGLAGFLLGFPAWYLGTRYINRHYEALRDGYVQDVETFGTKVLQAAGADPDTEFFTMLVWSADRPFLVEAPKQYDATVLGVGSDTLWVYDETTFDAMFLSAAIGTDTDEVTAFDVTAIDSVAYEDRELAIRTTDGEVFYAPSGTEPAEAMVAIRERMAAV